MLLQMEKFHFFMAEYILLCVYIYATPSLSIHLLMDADLDSIAWLL